MSDLNRTKFTMELPSLRKSYTSNLKKVPLIICEIQAIKLSKKFFVLFLILLFVHFKKILNLSFCPGNTYWGVKRQIWAIYFVKIPRVIKNYCAQKGKLFTIQSKTQQRYIWSLIQTWKKSRDRFLHYRISSSSASIRQTAKKNQLKVGVKVNYPSYKTLPKGKKNRIKF